MKSKLIEIIGDRGLERYDTEIALVSFADMRICISDGRQHTYKPSIGYFIHMTGPDLTYQQTLFLKNGEERRFFRDFLGLSVHHSIEEKFEKITNQPVRVFYIVKRIVGLEPIFAVSDFTLNED